MGPRILFRLHRRVREAMDALGADPSAELSFPIILMLLAFRTVREGWNLEPGRVTQSLSYGACRAANILASYQMRLLQAQRSVHEKNIFLMSENEILILQYGERRCPRQMNAVAGRCASPLRSPPIRILASGRDRPGARDSHPK